MPQASVDGSTVRRFDGSTVCEHDAGPSPARISTTEWKTAQVEIRELDGNHRAEAVALWDRTGLIRPWNPPYEDFDQAITGNGSAVLGAIDGDRLVATAMVGHDGHRGWDYYLAVDPEVQATGVGRAMMRAAEAWVREAGIPKIQLMVRSTHTAELGFYDAVGFTVEDTVILSRWLDRP
jgi:ribosomal protein S18 acetylase RimI-like enzyme